MARKRKGLGARALIDSELAEVETERERLDEERERLLAARAAYDREAVVPKARAPRVSRAQITEFLLANPDSTYMQVADGLGIKPTTAAKHLSRGGEAGEYRSDNGRWSVIGE